ncbi:MAG: IclR family transcriptional regulator [Trueperaceae bacterium]|nr:MAG: IclR family transcriptional regulator [Trueperaceae bacterium]
MSRSLIEKTFGVLEVLTERDHPQGLKNLAEATSLPKSTLHRILQILVELGYVEQQDTKGEYGLTPRLSRLGQGRRQEALKQRALPLMQSLHRRFAETVNLGVLQGRYVYYLHTIETDRPLRSIVSPGSRDAFHCTALGKAIAAFLPEHQLSALLHRADLEARTERTVTSKRRLRDELERIRLDGVACDDEENDAGVVCYGAPLLAGGYPLAAVSVSVPKVRLSEEVAAKLVASLCEVAGEAERQFEALA